MLGGGPKPRHVLDGKHQHAEAVEGAQGGTVIGGDVRHGLRHCHGNVGEDEPDQNPIDGARGRLPAAPMLEDLERALARLPDVLACRPRVVSSSPECDHCAGKCYWIPCAA